jgi:hypothetical protein
MNHLHFTIIGEGIILVIPDDDVIQTNHIIQAAGLTPLSAFFVGKDFRFVYFPKVLPFFPDIS